MQINHAAEPTKPQPFPVSAPTSFSSHESICQNDWDAFRGLDHMENHWTRSAWSAGQETYFWYLTFTDPKLSDMAERCQHGLGRSGLDWVPVDGLHTTLLKIGGSSHIGEDQIRTIAEVAKQGLSQIEPFDLAVGPLAGSGGAIRFSMSPWTEILRVHQTARAATLKELPDLTIADTEYLRPHLGIAYSNRRQPAEPLVSKVSQLRSIAPVAVRVESVQIVRLRRESNTYRWQDVELLRLGSTD